ncbi:hypothetical protein TWF192_004724 [Orbilia oligospora]|nr:hypothetical protein TWF192_004724 [Orbilia oligospora]
MHPSRRAYVEEHKDEDEDMGISIDQVPTDHDYVLPSISGIAPEKASAIIQQFDKKKRAAAITVPTDDNRVRAKLRELGEPITLFGEEKSDRRDRLRALLAAQLESGDGSRGVGGGVGGGEDVDMADADEEAGGEVEEEFYTEGIPELLSARQHIARFSLERARDRYELQQSESTVQLKEHIKHRKGLKDRLMGYNLFGTQLAGDRPIAFGAKYGYRTDVERPYGPSWWDILVSDVWVVGRSRELSIWWCRGGYSSVEYEAGYTGRKFTRAWWTGV